MKPKTKLLLILGAVVYVGGIVCIRAIPPIRPVVAEVCKWAAVSYLILYLLGTFLGGFSDGRLGRFVEILAVVCGYFPFAVLVFGPYYLAAAC